MRIRSGFVSNSSSSSFICNTHLSVDDVESKLHTLLDCYNELIKDTEHDIMYKYIKEKPLVYTDVFEPVFEVKSIDDPYVNMILDWCDSDYLKVISKNDLIGKIIINSVDDNSIPWELFDLINELFKANRIHLG